MDDGLQSYCEAWAAKPLLRLIYDDFYDRIRGACVPGPTVEIGSGIGALKARFPEIIATDIQPVPWLDLVVDAQSLPFPSASIANIVMVDVLHHVEFPVLFLREAERVLKPGGRLIMVEPAVTPGSYLFYRYVHRERTDMSDDPLVTGRPNAQRDPYDSNQAIPTLLVGRERARLKKLVPNLTVVRADWISMFVYPLSGGFNRWRLLPDGLGERLLALERRLERLLGRVFGFRLFIVMGKGAA